MHTSERNPVFRMEPPLIITPPPSPPPTPLPPEASLSTQERLRLAKRRRTAQLKRWAQREKEKHPDIVSSALGADGRYPHEGYHKGITFVSSVMLLESATRNDVDEVRRLLEMGVSPDSTNEDGLTALHQCCIDDSEEMMKVLLTYGGNPNATDTEKWTPLHAAATCGHLHLVKFLIDHGADLLAVNADGNMPYDLCEDETTLSYIENEMARRGVTQELIDETRSEIERKMLKDLKALGGDYLEVRDLQSDATPLHIASANGYLSVVEYLLDNHVSTEVTDCDLWQPIHAAACWGHLEVVELLAQNGADINAKTRNGETPFDICEDPEIKERLLQLKEQRVRLGQPRVRRSRSASTRTQSIRRTSLREKMNTTKRDVQDEKLFFMETFDKIPKKSSNSSSNNSSSNNNNSNGHEREPDRLDGSSGSNGHHNHHQKDPVDLNDVELTLLPSYVNNEATASESEQPQRPPRSAKETSATPPHSRGSPSRRPPGPAHYFGTDPTTSPTSAASASGDAPPVNIHVSVTINQQPGHNTSQQQQQQQQQHGTPNNAQTLAALKKARSMSRASINTSSSLSPTGGVTGVVESPTNRPHRELLVGEPMAEPVEDVRRSYHGQTADDFDVKSSKKSGKKHQKADFSGRGRGGQQPTQQSVTITTKKRGCCVVM